MDVTEQIEMMTAFSLLSAGDAFEHVPGPPPADGERVAAHYVRSKLEILSHGAAPQRVERVLRDVTWQLAGNRVLVERLAAARPIAIDLVPLGRSIAAFGYPRSASRRAAGLFWDHPGGPRARIALRQDRLDVEPALVVHEMAHAIHSLAFTPGERERLYLALLPACRCRAEADELFALYSEHEFLGDSSPRALRTPGPSGAARARGSEDPRVARFVRNLYFPYKPLTGASTETATSHSSPEALHVHPR